MFGYIAINKAEMKFKDYDMYQAYYSSSQRMLRKAWATDTVLRHDISHCPSHRALRTKDYDR
mgnify:CR=1 FL=1